MKANPGHRLEEISAALRISTKDLKRPVANLMEAGQLRTEGQKRGTRYFAGSGGRRRRPARSKKVVRRKAARKVPRRATRKTRTSKKRASKKKTVRRKTAARTAASVPEVAKAESA